MMKLVNSRKIAMEQGHTRYFTGKECANGHIAERSTVNGACSECLKGMKKDANEKYAAARMRSLNRG